MKLERILNAKRTSVFHGVLSGIFAGLSVIILYCNLDVHLVVVSSSLFGFFIASHYYNLRLCDLYYSQMESDAVIEQLLNNIEQNEVWESLSNKNSLPKS